MICHLINAFLDNPDPVNIDNFSITDKVGCRCRVQWQPLDTGKCLVEYHIQFINSCGRILGNVSGVRGNKSFYCTDAYADSYSVNMWATHNGDEGTKSQVNLLSTTSKSTTVGTKGMSISFATKKS